MLLTLSYISSVWKFNLESVDPASIRMRLVVTYAIAGKRKAFVARKYSGALRLRFDRLTVLSVMEIHLHWYRCSPVDIN